MHSANAQGAIAVTGTSRGIGAAIALELARRGFVVGCLSRGGRSFLDEPAPDDDLRPRLLEETCDVTDEAAIRRALHAVAERGGGLCGLVNNAGVHLIGPAAEFSTADFQQVLSTNLTGVFVACREAYPLLRAQGGGLIVNIGSFFGRLGVRHTAAYCASKAGLSGLTRSLAVEWGPEGIAVLNLAPGYVETEISRKWLHKDWARERILARIPAGRPPTGEAVARLVAAFYAERLPYLTGETIYMDGGLSVSH
ncbi:MAG: SDR family oxidoreductase [Candidatus Lambdaproteobacteria bacterium]|nr:SDR family oxidoreductase [Candidatus Lambdaproteobacteria bacterium]